MLLKTLQFYQIFLLFLTQLLFQNRINQVCHQDSELKSNVLKRWKLYMYIYIINHLFYHKVTQKSQYLVKGCIPIKVWAVKT